MIRNFNHAMSSGISIGTGAGSDVRGETWSGGGGGQSQSASWRITADPGGGGGAELAENHQNV